MIYYYRKSDDKSSEKVSEQVTVTDILSTASTSGICKSTSVPKNIDSQDTQIDTQSQSSSDYNISKESSRCSSRLQEDFNKLSIEGSAQQEAEMYFLQKENLTLQEKLHKLQCSFSFDHIQENDSLINMYTGFPNKYLFESVFTLFDNIKLNYILGWSVGNISRKDQFLITLMKLRLNLLHADLACRFNCSSTTISNIVNTWILALHEILFCQLMENIPSRNKNRCCMPACFSTFTNCRIVLDCTEVKCVKPISLEKQRLTYSSYKHQNTLKGLIGVAPNGVITFVSDLYPGSLSDKKIVKDSGIMTKMDVGDLILADKGFLIKDLLPTGVCLNIPPFLTTSQFTPQQVIQTKTIARARIHVERAIRRLKCYSILDSIPSNLISQSSKIFQVCGALTNMQFPLIAEVEDLYAHTAD